MVFARDGNACVYCSRKEGEYTARETKRDGYLHVDHVIPLTHGGSDDPSNLVTACGPCNLFKGDRTPDECGLRWPEHNGERLGNTKPVTSALAREEKRREEEKQSAPVPATPSTVVPIKPEKPEAEKRKALTFAGWLKTIPDGDLAIPADHFVFAQADRAGLPYQFVELEWEWFRWKYTNNPKRYTDWRQTFANAVAGAWGNLWRAVPAGGYELTSQGIQFQRTLEAAA